MPLKNFYPEKPTVPYQKTSVSMDEVVDYMHEKNESAEVLASAYFMFRNESGNGKSGINNNYVGAQADSGRWPEYLSSKITGIVKRAENGTQKMRLFLAFTSWKDSVDFLIDRVKSRGLYYNGFERLVTKRMVGNQTTLKEAYAKGWISWPKGTKPTPEQEAEALKAVNVALAYLRSWVRGSAIYVPDATTVRNIVSMYKSGLTKFDYKENDPY